MIKKSLACLILLMSIQPAFAIDDVNDYPITTNVRGLSGYYYVDSVQTLQPGKFQASLFGIGFSNDAADYKKGTGEAVLSVGLLDGFEGALVIPYIVQSGSMNGLGDIKLAGKIHLLDQLDEDIPALALAASIEFPTGDNNKGLRIVNSYGADLMLVAQSKIDLPDYSFNLVAEGGIYAQDISQTTEERHALFGAAGHFPLDDIWVIIVEGVGTSGYGNSLDYTTFSGSLRLFMKKFTLTAGIARTLATGQNASTGNSVQGSLNFPF
ncbi:MAG: transporter [Nitrospirae bacterium]|nr:transporter [Nitrospirota bacterium]MBI3594250.1 transporter [Nitrospirota bacterium]